MERINDEIVKALREIIIKAKDGFFFGKKVMLYLIEHSENLSKKVCINLPGKDEYDWGGQAADTVHAILGSQGRTFLGWRMAELGIKEARFSQRSSKFGYTIWLTDKDDRYSTEAEELIEEPMRLLKIVLIA